MPDFIVATIYSPIDRFSHITAISSHAKLHSIWISNVNDIETKAKQSFDSREKFNIESKRRALLVIKKLSKQIEQCYQMGKN